MEHNREHFLKIRIQRYKVLAESAPPHEIKDIKRQIAEDEAELAGSSNAKKKASDKKK